MDHDITDYLVNIAGRNVSPLVTITPEKLTDILTNIEPLNQSEITMTFRDNILETYTVPMIQKTVYQFMKKLGSKHHFTFFLVQDYSNTYRLHYHGIIWLSNVEVAQKIRLSIQRKFGRTQIRTINHPVEYAQYVFGIYSEDHDKYNPHVKWSNCRVINTHPNIVLVSPPPSDEVII